MFSKLQPTLFALAAALLFIAASALFAEPLPAGKTTVETTSVTEVRDSAAEQEESVASEQFARLKSRVELSMPYYSFGSVLPRRGS